MRRRLICVHVEQKVNIHSLQPASYIGAYLHTKIVVSSHYDVSRTHLLAIIDSDELV